MTDVVVLARVVLGVVLLLAGALKLADRSWPAQGAAFGVPPRVAAAVPIAETVIGACLVPGLGGSIPTAAALVLLVAFTSLLAARVVQGSSAPCACFGAWSSTRPVGWGTVVRNAVLLLLAVVAFVGTA